MKNLKQQKQKKPQKHIVYFNIILTTYSSSNFFVHVVVNLVLFLNKEVQIENLFSSHLSTDQNKSTA